MEHLNVSVIKPLYRMATFLAIAPAYDFEHKKGLRSSMMCSVLVFALYAVIAAISLLERFKTTYPFTPNITDMMLDFGSSIAITITNIASIYWIRMRNSGKLVKFLDNLQSIDAKLDAKLRGVKKRFTIETIFYGSLLTFGLVYNETFWDIVVGLQANWVYFFANFQRVHLFVTSMLAHNLALAFANRFKYLNSLLTEFTVASARKDSTGYKCEEYMSLKDINRVHKKLLLIYSNYNKIFGVPILCLSANFLFGLLHPMNSAILQLMKGNVISGLDVPHFGIHYVTITSIMTFNTMVLCVPLASSCNAAGSEAKKTLQLYRVLEDTLLLTDQRLKKMHRDLEETFSESVVKYPNFHAYGFYVLNHTTLLTLMGCISTYLMVLIQINVTPQ